MVYLFLGFIFFLGASLGSFLNVVLSRFGQTKKWYQGRSFCDHCHRTLKWWENIPLVSFLFLKGKCRKCSSPIPFSYFAVELITGLLFVFVLKYFDFQFSLKTFTFLLTMVLLLTTFLFDLYYQLIPDWAVIGLIILSLFWWFLRGASFNFFARNLFPSALGSGLFLGFLHLITKGKGMGLGDVKFSLFMGVFLGFPRVVLAFYLAFLTGAFLGVILILLRRKKFGQKIAFGPFLILGTLISFFWGELIIKKFLFFFYG